MAITIEDLEKQLGTGTLNPQVEQFLKEYMVGKSGKISPDEFRNIADDLMDNVYLSDTYLGIFSKNFLRKLLIFHMLQLSHRKLLLRNLSLMRNISD